MKRFIYKNQMNNSIFFLIVELVVLFMFRSSIHTTDVMMNTFSTIIIMIFIIPVVLSYFSTDILRIFNYMIIPRFQSKKTIWFYYWKNRNGFFQNDMSIIGSCSSCGNCNISYEFFMIMRYYFSFFITLVTFV